MSGWCYNNVNYYVLKKDYHLFSTYIFKSKKLLFLKAYLRTQKVSQCFFCLLAEKIFMEYYSVPVSAIL